jgi:hypothetical protein
VSDQLPQGAGSEYDVSQIKGESATIHEELRLRLDGKILLGIALPLATLVVSFYFTKD